MFDRMKKIVGVT